MRTVARSALLLFGHRCHVAAIAVKHGHAIGKTMSQQAVARSREKDKRKQKRNKSLLKRTLPGPQGLVGAAGKVCRGLSGAWELQGRVCRVLASFEGWQTAAWDLRKRTLPGLQGLVGAAGKVCRGLSGAWELQGRVWGVLKAGKRHPWTSPSLKRTLPRPLRDLLELQERSAAAWVAPGSCRGGFGEFCGLANGSLEPP